MTCSTESRKFMFSVHLIEAYEKNGNSVPCRSKTITEIETFFFRNLNVLFLFRNKSCALQSDCDQATVQTACHENCNVYHGIPYNEQCLPDGRCLCHYGWTGPNAKYIQDNEYCGKYKGLKKIAADYCSIPCHYEPNYQNPMCAQL